MARRRYNIETIKQIVDGENPFVQFGYLPKAKKRKEGEEWTDSKGITWKKENGNVIRVNKQMDSIREMIKQKCSVCGQRMDFTNDKLDHKVFSKTGKCFDCLQVEEMPFRINKQKWDIYENIKILKYKLGVLKDFKEKVIESIDYLKNDKGIIEEVMPTGEVMTFRGKSNPQWLIDAEKDLIKVNEEIKKIEDEVSKIKELV